LGVPVDQAGVCRVQRVAPPSPHPAGPPALGCRLAYDGRGNFVVRSAADLAAGVSTLGGLQQGLYAEQWQPFVKEMAVMVVRSRDGR